jgi:hypothetical protein
MLEVRGDARLPQEPRTEVGVARELRRKDLECDRASDAGVARQENLAHAPAAQLGDDFVDAESGSRVRAKAHATVLSALTGEIMRLNPGR